MYKIRYLLDMYKIIRMSISSVNITILNSVYITYNFDKFPLTRKIVPKTFISQ